MGIDEYLNEGDSVQKQTHVTFANPDHPDTSVTYADDAKVREHFQAANALQDSPINRKLITGDFIAAVNEDLGSDGNEALEAFFEELTE
jgi:hypothetical protein